MYRNRPDSREKERSQPMVYAGTSLGGTHGNGTPCRHRLFQIHPRITFESIALDAERPSIPGLCDRPDQPGDIVVAAAERLNQRAPIPALPVRPLTVTPYRRGIALSNIRGNSGSNPERNSWHRLNVAPTLLRRPAPQPAPRLGTGPGKSHSADREQHGGWIERRDLRFDRPPGSSALLLRRRPRVIPLNGDPYDSSPPLQGLDRGFHPWLIFGLTMADVHSQPKKEQLQMRFIQGSQPLGDLLRMIEDGSRKSKLARKCGLLLRD